MQRLIDPKYMAFPFRVGEQGPAASGRQAHIRQIVEQVLFTNPNERVFRPEFGAGVRRMVFEPNSAALWDLAQQRLIANLAEVLQGEVDPNSLEVAVGDEEKEGGGADSGILYIRVRYRLATINREETLLIPLQGGHLG
ncbi:MAG: GPW/gp25 family protein [Desulfatitalea sp.]|nr:GPW/gp25 family protein [Desulfatitalea sp.]NNJ99337.1 GPW/gp25 family protein [Desulfatitalea sp.]